MHTPYNRQSFYYRTPLPQGVLSFNDHPSDRYVLLTLYLSPKPLSEKAVFRLCNILMILPVRGTTAATSDVGVMSGMAFIGLKFSSVI